MGLGQPGQPTRLDSQPDTRVWSTYCDEQSLYRQRRPSRLLQSPCFALAVTNLPPKPQVMHAQTPNTPCPRLAVHRELSVTPSGEPKGQRQTRLAPTFPGRDGLVRGRRALLAPAAAGWESSTAEKAPKKRKRSEMHR